MRVFLYAFLIWLNIAIILLSLDFYGAFFSTIIHTFSHYRKKDKKRRKKVQQQKKNWGKAAKCLNIKHVIEVIRLLDDSPFLR